MIKSSENKIKVSNLNLEQFFKYVDKPIAFKIDFIDVEDAKIGFSYVIGLDLKNGTRTPSQNIEKSIKNYITSNTKGFKINGFLMEMVGLVLDDDVSTSKAITKETIEDALIDSMFLYIDGVLELI